MTDDIRGKKVAMLVDNYFEQAEFTGPKSALEAAGAEVDVIAVESEDGQVQALQHIDKGDRFPVDKTLDEADLESYDALVLPGGAINADALRMVPKAREWVKQMVSSDRPLAVICHAPWVLASAGMAKGRKLTSYFTIQDDMRDAGAEWVDEEVVIDGNLITSRNPDDVPAFSQAIIAMLKQGSPA